jgi:hypothetical protein
MPRSPARQKKRTKAVASLSKRRKFLVSMLSCILFQECGRADTAFSSFPRHPSYVRGRNFVSKKMFSVTLRSAPNDSESLDEKGGLILPSHPNFPIKSVMAPMVAASDYPFRFFLRKHCDVDLTFVGSRRCLPRTASLAIVVLGRSSFA